MDAPILNDPNQYPTQDIIILLIGKSQRLWESLFEYIHKFYPDFTEEWRYYNDGKRWLLKVTRKSKTIFWLSVLKGTFRTTFYFTVKAKEAIGKSSISDELKTQFSKNQGNKIKGVTIIFKKKKDVEYAKELIAIKLITR